jgi:tryptophan synthase alpha chain
VNRLESRLSALRRGGRRALAPYVTAGDCGYETTLSVLRALDEPDVACVELGLPFSDPIADGPVLQAAAERALAAGATFERSLAAIERLRRGASSAPPCDLPIAVMAYANLLVRRGWNESLAMIARAGADALLVPDLPVEEGAPMASAAVECGLAPIFFVSPTTDDERMQRAIAMSRGFVYAIGRVGVTGAPTAIGRALGEFLARVRSAARARSRASELSIAVGFGIATPEHVSAATREGDLAITGSALVQRVHEAALAAPENAQAAAAAARAFVRELARGLPR